MATYDVILKGRKISVSMFTVELFPTEAGTRLVSTEQGAFLDELDTNEQRQIGAESDLETLERYLFRADAKAVVNSRP